MSRCRRLHPGKNLHQGRFARAVFAEQRGDLAPMDVEVHALQRMHAAVRLDDVPCRQQHFAGRGLSLVGLVRGAHFTSSFTGVTSQPFGLINWKTPTTEMVLPVSLAVSTFDKTAFFIAVLIAYPAF